MIRYALFASLALLTGALFFACNGTTGAAPQADAATPSSGADGGDGALPAADDAGDARAMTTQDAGAPDAANAAACTADAGTTCLACCAAQNPGAYAAFTALVKTCACTAEVCGPLEASVAPGDAGDAAEGGVFGEGACASECSAATVATSATPACETCLRHSIGSTSAPGVCEATAVQCVTVPACVPFYECIAACQ